MKPTTYINWDGLKDIPFFYCDTKEDEEKLSREAGAA